MVLAFSERDETFHKSNLEARCEPGLGSFIQARGSPSIGASGPQSALVSRLDSRRMCLIPTNAATA